MRQKRRKDSRARAHLSESAQHAVDDLAHQHRQHAHRHGAHALQTQPTQQASAQDGGGDKRLLLQAPFSQRSPAAHHWRDGVLARAGADGFLVAWQVVRELGAEVDGRALRTRAHARGTGTSESRECRVSQRVSVDACVLTK